jgi:hypothetical protein
MADLVQHQSWSWIFIGLFTASCFAISVFFTHGIAGPWRHYLTEWRFYQPGVGGFKFVLLQALSWAFFSISMCIFGAHLLSLPALGVVQNRNMLPSMVSGGIAGVLGELLMTASLFVYRSPIIPIEDQQQQPALRRILRLFVVAIFYNTQTIMGFLIWMSVQVANIWPNFIVMSWLVGVVVYGPTYLWSPGLTGRRRFPIGTFQPIYDIMASYFDLKIFSAAKEFPTKNGEKYIFAYHPHGLLPISCAWSTQCSAWMKMFPKLRLAYMTAR